VIAAGKCVFAVTPNAAHGTAGETYERARPAGVRRFALDREECLGYTKGKISVHCRAPWP
jgi:hypothetical protein